MEEPQGSLKTFRSRTEHGLDGKGRLNIPARFRDVLAQTYDDDTRLIVTPPWPKCLRVYPLQEWAKLEVELMRKARENPEAGKMVEYLIGGAADAKIDKNGRILLPVIHRDQAHLVKDVMLVGLMKYFTIWDKETYASEHVITDKDFSTVADLSYI